LLFWELVISFLLLGFICLNDMNLWACVYFYYHYSFMLNNLLGWILLNKSFVDLFLWYHLDNKCVLPHLLYLLVLLVFLSKFYFLWILKVRCMHILFMLNFVS
jgi:hypothetical protein